MSASLPEVELYVKSRKVVTSFYRVDPAKLSSANESALASAGTMTTSSMQAATEMAQRDGAAEVAYMLPDEQARVVELVEEVAARRGYVVKVTDVGKANPLAQFVETHLKGVDQFPVLLVPSSKQRVEGLAAFSEQHLCAILPAELKKTRAFSYLKVKGPDVKEVQRMLLTMEEVREVHLVTGDWDVLAVLELPATSSSSKRHVLDFILDRVAKINGVADTSTMVPEYSITKFPL